MALHIARHSRGGGNLFSSVSPGKAVRMDSGLRGNDEMAA